MQLDVGPLLRTLRRQPAVLALFVLEIAASVVTISALLLSGSWYLQISQRPSGVDEQNLIMVSTYSTGHDASDAERDREAGIAGQQRTDRERMAALPDVVGLTQLSTCVLDDRWSYPALYSSLRPDGARLAEEVGWAVWADEQFASVLHVPFLAGAMPRPDQRDARIGVILTRTFADRLFGGATNALGATLIAGADERLTVTGVVENVRMRMPFMPKGDNVLFRIGAPPADHEARLIVRARPGRRDAVLASLRTAFRADNATRFVHARSFDSNDSIYARVGNGLFKLLGTFGVMLGVVVMMGALAATSFLVAQRTRQIGVRRALGATRADIVGYFLLESVLATTVGSLVGVLGAAVVYRPMRRVFTGITFDLRLIGASLLLLWTAAILATLIPALRAARVSPSVASRSL